MEVVPELVFLSCCNLGKADVGPGYAPHRLAYSLARELIEMGVRCVVAAGWEVDDLAAKTFSATFFERFVGRGDSFGNALLEARRACHQGFRHLNTWGAYQAYGDPAFTLGERATGEEDDEAPLLAPVELLDWLHARRQDARRGAGGSEKDRYRRMAARVALRLRALPPAWLERPDVQQALGALYAEFGEHGFDKAQAAYQAAIAADSTTGVASLAAVEQLANLEARTAGRLRDRAAALERVSQAIARLELLQALTAGAPPAARPNTERWSLLGSAYKRRAEILALDGRDWQAVAPELAKARDAYQAGEGDPAVPGFNPYATLNRLQLDALLGAPAAPRQGLIDQCQAAARRRFEASFDFWDGVMPADAEVARCLLDHSLAGKVKALQAMYEGAVAKLSPSARQFDSVVRQLALLATFAERAGHPADAAALGELAAALGGATAPVPEPAGAGEGGAAPPAPAGKGGRRGRAKKG
jgi:hypothetical protein